MMLSMAQHAAKTIGHGPLWLQRLASLKVTLLLLLLLVTGVTAYYFNGRQGQLLLATPLLLLTVNLLAAIVVHPRFRHHPPLLVFHLALLALLGLVTIGRLTYLEGQVEVTSGGAFPGTLHHNNAGPLHDWRLGQVQFRLEQFSIDYDIGGNRGKTRCLVHWLDEEGRRRQGTVGDHHPLVLHGYRFYTTHNKGFAADFLWHPESGEAEQGTVHFPAYPGHKHRQAMEWQPPGYNERLWTQLDFDETIIDPEEPSQFRPPREHHLIVRYGEHRHELRPGERLALPGGTLEYRGLTTWMGFKVRSDWTMPWLLAAVLVAVLSLGWHYWRKFASKPWLEEESN